MIHRIKQHLLMTKFDSDVLPPSATERQEFLVILQKIVIFHLWFAKIKMDFSSLGGKFLLDNF